MFRTFLRSLLARRPLITLVLVAGLCVVLWLIWEAVFGLSSAMSTWSRIITPIAILVIWLSIELVLFRRRRRANVRMLETLTREGVTLHNAPADSDISEISQHLADAIDFLRREMVGNGRSREFAYAMPWYLLIGADNAGKAQLVQNSGLKLPLEGRIGRNGLETQISGGSVRWWITDEALLIRASASIVADADAASRGTTAWRGLLNFLHTQRPRRPLDGLIVVVSVDSLLDGSASTLGTVLHQRLQQAMRILSVRLQVYLVISQCGHIAGFEEFFAASDRDARQQAFGAAMLPEAERRPGEIAAMLRVELGRAFDAIAKTVPFRAGNERDPARRALVVGFPEQLALVGEAAVEFAALLGGAGRHERPVMLRGVFFTEAGDTSAGRAAIDLWQPGFGRSMALVAPTRQLVTSERQGGGAFFVTGLFRDFIFPEAGLAGRSPRAERRTAMIYGAGYAACALGALATSGLWYSDFHGNQVELTALRNSLGVELALLPNARPERGIAAVLPLLNQARQLSAIDDTFTTPTENYTGISTLSVMSAAQAATNNYRQMLVSFLLPALRVRLEDQLRTGMATGIPDEELIALLRVYLMLGDPEHYVRADVVNWASKVITASFPAGPVQQGQLFGHLAALLNMMPLPVTIDTSLVDSARAKLQQRSAPDRIYARLIDQAQRSNDVLPIDVVTALGSAASQLLMLRTQAGLPVVVPALYTREGFYRIFLISAPLMVQGQERTDWIFGPQPPSRSDEVKATLRQVANLYVRDYIKQWQSVVNQISLRALPDLTTLVSATQTLSGPESPLNQFIDLIKTNADLTPPAAAPATAPASSLLSRATSAAADVAGNSGAQTVAAAASALNPTAAPAASTFDPWPGDAIRAPFLPLLSLLETRNGQAPVLVVQSTVAGTYSALLPVSTAPVPKVAAQALAARVISGQAADPLIGLRVQAATLPKPINGIFRDLYSNAWSALLSLSLEQVQTVWSQDIAPVCEQSISGRYPFVTNSGEREATLRDFSNFFGPGGLLEKFVSANLLMFAQIGPDGGLTVSSQNGLSLNLSRDALEAINHARKMRDVYFGGDGTLSVRFALTPSYLDPRALSATFAVDQTRLTYRHEPPRAVGFTWPSTAESTASLSVETTDGMRPELQASGPWAVFHLLDQAEKSLGPSRDQIQIMFKLGDIRVGYNLRASSVVNPMMATDVREFRCVPRL